MLMMVPVMTSCPWLRSLMKAFLNMSVIRRVTTDDALSYLVVMAELDIVHLSKSTVSVCSVVLIVDVALVANYGTHFVER